MCEHKLLDIFRIGLRVDKEILDFLDKYHYGTRSEIVRNILYERIVDEAPLDAMNRLLNNYARGQIGYRDFVKKYVSMKNICHEMLVKYNALEERIIEVENSGMLNEVMGRLRLEEEQKLEKFFTTS